MIPEMSETQTTIDVGLAPDSCFSQLRSILYKPSYASCRQTSSFDFPTAHIFSYSSGSAEFLTEVFRLRVPRCLDVI